jgi:NADH-quinone oxidoreductase subunit I
MYGWGIIKTLAITLGHFFMTFIDDIRLGPRKRYSPAHLQERLGPAERGVFTIQYPQERRPLPERTRNLPFLVIDAQSQILRCTACGVCAQMCPAQCIWIERARDPETGRPRRYPLQYHIDISLCMSCGYCEEFCPYDAIKMDQNYELSSYARPGFIDARAQAKPEAYHAQIHPAAYREEQTRRTAAQESTATGEAGAEGPAR